MDIPHIFEAHDNTVLGVRFTPDNQFLISAGMDSVVKLWSVPNWEIVNNIEGHRNSVNSIALSPDATTLATGSTDCTVRLWSLPDGRLLHSFRDRKKVVASVFITADGERVVAGSYGGRVAIWTLLGEPFLAFKANNKHLSSAIVTPDQKNLIVSGIGDDISVWSLPSGEELGRLTGHRTAVGSLHLIDDGRTLVSMGYEGTIKFWDTHTWSHTRTVPAMGRGAIVSPDEETVLVLMEGRVQLWSIDYWTLKDELPIATRAISTAAFSPDGRWLAVGAADRRLRIWEME